MIRREGPERPSQVSHAVYQGRPPALSMVDDCPSQRHHLFTVSRKHSERCADCKKSLEELLRHRFGIVLRNHNLELPATLEGWRRAAPADTLGSIYQNLQRFRGHQHFVRRKQLPRVDFFVPGPAFVLEFDESQHFTSPRDVSLSHYPADSKFGFDCTRWRRLCQSLNKKDNDPPFRDEQRAWYDTLRDFAPTLRELRPTVRICAGDVVWCAQDRTDGLQFLDCIVGPSRP